LLKKYDRWQSILREAAEQCGRGRIPTLAAPLEWDVAVNQAQGVRLLPWEAAKTAQVSLGDWLTAQPDEAKLNLLIGPEGGIAPAEVEVAQAAGWQVVSLGPRILRAETAALASITITMAKRGEMG
jgi:16S rRNA (uracil1498-N3)-methyltransferase